MTSVKSCRANVTAIISDAAEIAMGAPTSGELKLSNGMRRDNCSPFMGNSSATKPALARVP